MLIWVIGFDYLENEMSKAFAVGQNWKTKGGEVATIVAIKKDGMMHVKIGARAFMNVLDANGHEPEMGVNARDALVSLVK